MLSKKALNLYGKLCERPFTPTSIADLKRSTGENSYNALTRATKQWRSQGLVKTTKKGRNILYTPDLQQEASLHLLCLANLGRLPRTPAEAIRILQDALEKKNVVWYSIILFGSHADGTAKKGSDVDLYLLTPTRHPQVTQAVAYAKLQTTTTLDIYHDTINDFKKMLDNDEHNLAKAIAHNHKAITNPRPFYEAIRESRFAATLRALP